MALERTSRRLAFDTTAELSAHVFVLSDIGKTVNDLQTSTDYLCVREGTGTAALEGLGSATSISNNSVTNAKLRDSGALSVIGRSANSSGDPADISATAASGAVLRESGSVLGFGTVSTDGIAANAVTDAKLRNSAAYSVIGRATGTGGSPADIAASADGQVLQRTAFGVLFATIPTASIDDDAVTNAKLRNSGALSVIGRSANSGGNPGDISATAASDAVLRESGSVLGFGTIATGGIADDAVTDAKLRNSAALSVVGRSANSTGSPADISATAASGQFLRESGSVLGFGTDLASTLELSTEAGITASTTQAQGQMPLTKTINQFSTVATSGDAATMPAAVAGRIVVIIHDGAQTLGLYPASGDDIESYGVNAVFNISAAARYIFFAIDSTNWRLVNTVTGG